MVKAKESEGTSVLDSVEEDAFYHVGLVPATGDALFVDPEKSDSSLKRMDAWRLWSSPESLKLEKGFNFFIAKIRQFLGLSVRGFHFPSTSEYVEMSKTGASRMPFAGGVAKLSPDALKAVIKSCYRHIVRFRNGFERMDDPTQPVEIIDLDFGTSAGTGMSESEFSAYKIQHPTVAPAKFNPKTDKYIAEFVYIKKLDVTLDPADYEGYTKNSNRFHYQWVGPVKRDFFEVPPKSVLETYPQA